MNTGYEQVTAALGNLKLAVEVTEQREVRDIEMLVNRAKSDPTLAFTLSSVLAIRPAKLAGLRSAWNQADLACKGELQRASSVVLVKEDEAAEREERADRFAAHARHAEKLRNADNQWLGDASGLYRDTADVCSRGLAEIGAKLQNSADYCTQIANAHRVTYARLAQVIQLQAMYILSFVFVPFGTYFRRIQNARTGLEHVVREAARAASGELVRDGLIQGGAAARQVANLSEILESEGFRADPAKV